MSGKVRGFRTSHQEKEIHDVFRLARKLLAQQRILGRDAHRACVEMAFTHHDAAEGDERSGSEAVFFRA